MISVQYSCFERAQEIMYILTLVPQTQMNQSKGEVRGSPCPIMSHFNEVYIPLENIIMKILPVLLTKYITQPYHLTAHHVWPWKAAYRLKLSKSANIHVLYTFWEQAHLSTGKTILRKSMHNPLRIVNGQWRSSRLSFPTLSSFGNL